MRQDEIVENLVEIAIEIKRTYGQDAYNDFYELCKEKFAENIFEFAELWVSFKRQENRE